MSENLQKIDHSALRVNQAMIILLSILAFIFNQAWLALLVALVMGIGTLLNIPGFFWVYKRLLKPIGLVKPDVLWDNPEPHRFAQGLGSVFLLAASLVGNYPPVARIGGTVWVGLLSLIVSMPVVTARMKKRYRE